MQGPEVLATQHKDLSSEFRTYVNTGRGADREDRGTRSALSGGLSLIPAPTSGSSHHLQL